jgi:hypothetical protein
MRQRMRIAFLLLALGTPAFAQADDDPKASREEPSSPAASPIAKRADSDDYAVVHDEDDPKTSRAPALHKVRSWKITHQVPRVKLAYRYFSTVGISKADPFDWHAGELDYYPSSGYLRFGLDTELGFAGGPYDAWYMATGPVLGFQYPARVTPYLEARFLAGLLGGTAMGATAVSYIYMGGLDTGLELYLGGRFYVTLGVGWVHPVFSAVDIDWVKAHPGLAPARKDFGSDSFTIKVGIGL